MERARYDDGLAWRRSSPRRVGLLFSSFFSLSTVHELFQTAQTGWQCVTLRSALQLPPAVGTRPPLWHPGENFASALNSHSSFPLPYSHLFETKKIHPRLF
jgi:hypothetical protein